MLVPFAWLLLTAFATHAAAQQVVPVPLREGAKAQLRALDDLRRIDEQLRKQPHAYTAACRAVLGHDDGTVPAIPYSGAFRDGIDLLRVGDLSQLTHGEHQVQRTGDGAWTKPQGDMPDCPLSPRVLSHHLLDATVADSTAVAFDDKPAQRVHVLWQAAAAAALFDDVHSLDPKASKLVERLGEIQKKLPPERLLVDAVVVYDPSSRTLHTATLRIALLHTDEQPADVEPLPSPVGLPSLPRDPLLLCTFTLQLQPTTKVPWPELDAGTLQRLQPAK